MHGGYWDSRIVSSGSGNSNIVKSYIPNSRETYCNSVTMLRSLLRGYFDKAMEEAEKKLQGEPQSNDKEKTPEQITKEKIKYHQDLFEQLVMLGKRLNFFEEEASEEEM